MQLSISSFANVLTQPQQKKALESLLTIVDGVAVANGIKGNKIIESAEAEQFKDAVAAGKGNLFPAEAALTGFAAEIARDFTPAETVTAAFGDLSSRLTLSAALSFDELKAGLGEGRALSLAQRLARTPPGQSTPAGSKLDYAEVVRAAADPLLTDEMKQDLLAITANFLEVAYFRANPRSIPVYQDTAAGISVDIVRKHTFSLVSDTECAHSAFHGTLVVKAPPKTRILVASEGGKATPDTYTVGDGGEMQVPTTYWDFVHGPFGTRTADFPFSASSLIFVSESDGVTPPRVLARVKIELPSASGGTHPF